MTPATRQGLSVGIATALYGVSFGALSTVAGLTVLQTCALSLLMFSGGSQFALVGVLGGGGAAGAAITGATLLSVRLSLYGMQMSPVMAPKGFRRIPVAWLTIDEPVAVAAAHDDPAEKRRGFWVTGLTIYLGWNLMTFAGALLGNAVGDPRRYGLDAAAAAAFLGLLWPRLRQKDSGAVAAVAALVAVVLSPLVPPGLPIIAAAGVAVVAGLVWSRP